ncbi:MAG TPA: sugar dehydrogenase, partial [Elusimicrobiota bacterium]|nr:sugar dehydrogenase [Elusimicrobiota bacterium]
GVYVYGDFVSGRLRGFRAEGTRAAGDRELGVSVPALSSFAEDVDGELYAISLQGPIYRLSAR